MSFDLNTFLTEMLRSVVPALLGGGIVMLWTLPERKGGARLDNAERVLKKYEDIIDRLDRENTQLKKEIEELKIESMQLRANLGEVNTRMKTLQIIEEEDRSFRCENLRCKKRKPRLSQSTIEKMMCNKENDE